MTDPRIQNLSYSSLLQLHSCPRKFELQKKQATLELIEDDTPTPQSVTFAYGHLVGEGIQLILEGKSEAEVLWQLFLNWPMDILADSPKQNKSFFKGIHALNQFRSIYESGFLEGYKLVYYEGKPANELSFCIELPDGFYYRGFVDSVLQHEVTGEVLVLECKTTAATNVNPAQYKNSAQAIGYSIVLDAIFPTLSAYKVLYLVYQTKSQEFVALPFDKSYYARSLWISELLLDIERIKLYESESIYPMHGESCYSWMRECEYLNVCTLPTQNLTTPPTQAEVDKLTTDREGFQIKITLQDLIQAQINKNTTRNSIDSELL